MQSKRIITVTTLIVVIATMVALFVGCTPMRDSLTIEMTGGRKITIALDHDSVQYAPINQVVYTEKSAKEVADLFAESVPKGERAEVVTIGDVMYVHYYRDIHYIDTISIVPTGKNIRIESDSFVPAYLFGNAKSDQHAVNSAENNAFVAVFHDRDLLQDAATYVLQDAKYEDSFARLVSFMKSIPSYDIVEKTDGSILVNVSGKYIILKAE